MYFRERRLKLEGIMKVVMGKKNLLIVFLSFDVCEL